MGNGRRTAIRLEMNGRDVSADLAPHLVSMTLTDNIGSTADSLDIELEDRANLLISDWFPTKGMTVVSAFDCLDWFKPGETMTLPCGTFYIDDINGNGPGGTVTLRCMSIQTTATMRTQRKSRAWESTTLRKIATDIATSQSLAMEWYADFEPDYSRLDQKRESDLAFLARVCEDEGLRLKVTRDKIVIFDEDAFEKRPSVVTITRGESNVLRYSFGSKIGGTYKAAKVKRHKSTENETIVVTVGAPSGSATSGETLQISQRVESRAHAERLAKQKLKAANRTGETFSLVLVGDPRLVAGVNVNLVGWGHFDGKYLIDRAVHKPTGGYTTSLDMHKTLTGYA